MRRLPRVVLSAALALSGCSLFHGHDEDQQRATGEVLRATAVSRGKFPKPSAADAVSVLAEPAAEALQDAAPGLSDTTERALDRAGESVLDAASTVAEPAGAGIDAAAGAVVAPLAPLGRGLEAAERALNETLSPVKSATQEAFERSRSVKKTARAFRAETNGDAAAAVIAALDPRAKGAKAFVSGLLEDPRTAVREAAAHKLREIFIGQGASR